MKKMFLLAIVLFSICLGCNDESQSDTSTTPHYCGTPLDIRQVELTDNFWLPKIAVIQDSTIAFSFNKCYEEGRMDNFLVAGGVKEGKCRGKMPFDDTDLYKIIEGASLSLISKPDSALDSYIDSIISIIKIGQEPDGYLTTWFTIDPMSPPATWVMPNKERWASEAMSHELYNSGHMFEAAAAHYRATGKRNFLDIALKNADLLVDNFGEGKLTIVPGHQIVETGLVKLYEITEEKKYLDLAKFYLDHRGDTTRTSFGAYSQDHLPVVKQDEAVGHAVRAVYMYAAMTDVAALYGDTAYNRAINAIWDNIVGKKMYLTGGIGASHRGEAFGGNYELPNTSAYNETCAAIGDVYWNHRMFLMTENKKYFDVIERTLYNGLISGISIDGCKFFYPNPLRSEGGYIRQPWFECSCCPTNLVRFMPSIPNLIYTMDNNTLFVNLYIANKTSFNIANKNVEIVTETEYPRDGNIRFVINPETDCKFTLKLRVPAWVENQVLPSNLYSYADNVTPDYSYAVNDETKGVAIIENGYITIDRKWQKGDKVTLSFPMNVRRVKCNENVSENIGKTAVEYGPIVYCAEEIDNDSLLLNVKLKQNADFVVSRGNVLSEAANIITTGAVGSDSKDYKLTLIPYYLWANRTAGKMTVWIDEQ